jgi:UDPglucose 6-dehydrogenase
LQHAEAVPSIDASPQDRVLLKKSIVAFDPAAMVRAEAALPKLENLSFASSAYEACSDADALLVLGEWQEFYSLDLPRIKKLLRLPILLGGRNVFDPPHVRAAGLHYYGIGSSPARKPPESVETC